MSLLAATIGVNTENLSSDLTKIVFSKSKSFRTLKIIARLQDPD